MSIFGPEVDRLIEEDKRILKRGKIVWEEKLYPITSRIEECLRNLNLSNHGEWD